MKKNKADTERTLHEIEVALAKTDMFSFVRNIVAFNVNGLSEVFPLHHEADMLVMSKSGYLTEIEIKRSWSDFLADFKKSHHHDKGELVKTFYYCIPASLHNRVVEYLDDIDDFGVDGIVTYTKELRIELHPYRHPEWKYEFHRHARKLFLEQQLELARFGAMRSVTLRETLANAEKEISKLKLIGGNRNDDIHYRGRVTDGDGLPLYVA